jgi:hypothetical protein
MSALLPQITSRQVRVRSCGSTASNEGAAGCGEEEFGKEVFVGVGAAGRAGAGGAEGFAGSGGGEGG